MRLRDERGWAELRDRQRGVVTRAQAMSHGLDDDLIGSRLRSGRWSVLHRGVYATFSGEPGRAAVLWAAVLRGGPGAALSHETAAEVLELADDRSTLIHLTVPGRRHPQAIRGVLVHRSSRARAAVHPAQLPPRTRVEGTTIDLAQAAASLDDACGWLSRATGRRLTTAARLRATLDSRPKVRWRAGLELALAEIGSGAHSLLEQRYIRDVERPHGLPTATRQARTGTSRRSRYIDNLYEEARLAVELDGQVAHAIEERWADMHRDNAHATAGILTLRYNWADVTGQPCTVARQVGAVLRQRGTSVTLHPCRPACTALTRPLP
jgi:Transcriptional regulator, AbiEi antitoxin